MREQEWKPIPLFSYAKHKIEKGRAMTGTEKKVYELVKPIIEKIGYIVYDVIYEKEGQQNYLRIFIDKEDGISINDCETVNNAITDILDEKDYIKNAYMLEVSSPGIERRLRSTEHYKQNIDKTIEIHTFSNIENTKEKHISGILKQVDDENIILQVEEKEITIPRSNISKANQVYEWN